MPRPEPEPTVSSPRPKGPTRDAEATETVDPEIPDSLKRADFRSFVRVRVEVEPDGRFTPVIRSGSGNADIDRRVLEALRKWRWKPALRDGVPVRTTQLFKFEFEVK
jgi:protein TonB